MASDASLREQFAVAHDHMEDHYRGELYASLGYIAACSVMAGATAVEALRGYPPAFVFTVGGVIGAIKNARDLIENVNIMREEAIRAAVLRHDNESAT